MKIVLQNLTKKFPGRGRKKREEVVAVKDFTFEIPDGTLVGLLGPSGCGKSTVLNLISGLEQPTEGKIFFGEDDVTDLPAEHRGIGLVFQNYALYPHLNVKIGATHAGISVGEDGATHQCNEDLALMRAIPGMVVINPSDDVEARAAVKAAYFHEGPVYLRFGRLAVPVINDYPDYCFEVGKGVKLREGSDVTVIATGLCVSHALEAAERLAAEGIEAQVINIHTIKPLDEELVIKAARETGKVVTVEEHSVIGGLGSAVCDVLCGQGVGKVRKLGIQDVFGESGPAAELIHKYGLDGEGIYRQVKEFVEAD